MQELHGKSKTKTYRSWKAMRMRCLNENDISYFRYGERGICFCKRWNRYTLFFKDMGERPKGTSLDRIDNNKGYSKKNCRWATKKEQANNRRSNVKITFKGETKNLSEWADYLGIKRSTLNMRLYYYNWSVERAFKI